MSTESFHFDMPYPDLNRIKARMNVPKKSFIESFISSKEKKRLALEELAMKQYAKEVVYYNEAKEQAYELWKYTNNGGC